MEDTHGRGSPIVSVIIPSYNMGRFVGEAIRSVLEGTFQCLEVIVVDDGSTDDTESVVREFTTEQSPTYDPRVEYHYQENAGKPAALNRALQHVRGDYIVFLDADDHLPPRGISARYEAVESASGASPELIVGGFYVFREEEILGGRPAPVQSDPDVLRRQFLFSYKTPFHLNGCFIDRSLQERTGFFDENLKRSEDQDYILRMLDATEEVVTVDETVYKYRKYRSSLQSRVRYRLLDLTYRPQMIAKHASGLEKVLSIMVSGFFDISKLVYQIKGSYHY